MKFQYLGKGAEYWSRLSEKRKDDDRFGLFEVLEVREEIARQTEKGDSIYLVDLGCGNGEPAEIIIRRLLEKDVNIEYVPVDISPELLKIATMRVERLGVPVDPVLMDFDRNSLIRVFARLDDRPAHVLLLGNTLGNHSNELKIIANVRDAMRQGDLFYLGLYMYVPYKIGSIVQSYQSSTVKKFVTNVTHNLFGIKPKDTKLEVYFYELGGKRQILLFLRMMKDYFVELSGYKFSFRKGDRILVARSVRYTPAQVAKLAEDTEMRFVHFAEDKYGAVSVAALVPKRTF